MSITFRNSRLPAAICILITGLLLGGAHVFNFLSEDSQPRSLADRVEYIRRETETPAVVAGAFDENGTAIAEFVLGTRDITEFSPVERSDRFRIGSVSV